MFKKWLTLKPSIVILAIVAPLFTSCNEKLETNNKKLTPLSETETKKPKKSLSKEFKEYWYVGNAEITSYTLEQARYGEIREGKAVKIFVTEPFLKTKQVKADGSNPDNIPVLKLNTTKNYLTGIYPYSIMTSSFYPVHDNTHAIKVAFSSQEWCGQVYAQLNNRKEFQISSHSYFETEADEDIVLDKSNLEDEIWNRIRIDPMALPIGDFNMIPSLEFIRLTHKDLKEYKANAKLTTENGLNTYEISYPELSRILAITFSEVFPFSIESWSDSSKSGYGANAQTLTSKGTKIARLKTPYWRQNGNKDLYLRDSLGL
ncbi:MAG: hypothetical protein ACJART_002869 [Maribacter sp.]|jgi:hypothetical protein